MIRRFTVAKFVSVALERREVYNHTWRNMSRCFTSSVSTVQKHLKVSICWRGMRHGMKKVAPQSVRCVGKSSAPTITWNGIWWSTLEINLLVATSVGRHSTSCSTLTPTWWSIPARNHSAARSAARPSFRTKTENSIWKPTALRAWRCYRVWSSLTPPPTQTQILKPHMIQRQTTLMLHQTMRIKRSSNAPPPLCSI